MPESFGPDGQSYPSAGMSLGGYHILEILGHGSMATVFRATDDSGHEVALKVFMQTKSVSRTMLERFRREAEASKKLRRHPHILTVYSTGQDGPYHYIAMQPIEGSRTLEDALSRGDLEARRIVEIIVAIAEALHYAHERGIVHRDVKPTNILIDEFDQPLLTDFGVAALLDWPSFTASGALTGTPLYMSPEQAAGEKAGPASDQYALAVVLYEALSGMLPQNIQRCAPVRDVLKSVSEQPPRRLRRLNPRVSPDLEAVILKALEKRPSDRYADCAAFADDLERARTRRPVRVHRFSWPDILRYSVRRYRSVLLGILLGLGVIVGIQLYYKARIARAQFESLVHLASLRSMSIDVQRTGTHPPAPVSRAWQEIRLGRRDMAVGRWQSASRRFQAAVHHASELRDERTMAHARLEQARSETMLENIALAQDLYRWVIRCPDASQLEASLAQLEYMANAILYERPDDLPNALLWRPLPESGPLRDALLCVDGRMPPDVLLARESVAPAELRDDLVFAAAIRYYAEGDEARARELIRRTMSASSRSSDWPTPLARHLYGKLFSS